MTREHFELIAETMKEARPFFKEDARGEETRAYGQWANDCTALATCFVSINPRFDRQRFMTACGY